MEATDRLRIAKELHKETGCGMLMASTCIRDLVDKLKHRPDPICDVGTYLKMEWTEYDLRKGRKE